jgi:hypothetical protein
VSAAEVKAYADKYYLNDPKGIEKARAELKRQGFEE